MKVMFYLFLFSLLSVNLAAQDVSFEMMPNSKYYKWANEDGNFQFVTAGNRIKKNEPAFLNSLKQEFVKEGADAASLDQIVTITPFPGVVFSVSIDGFALYSNDGGTTWSTSTLPFAITTTDNYRKFAAIDGKVYFLPNYFETPLVSEDNCATWTAFSSDKFYTLSNVGDSTLFCAGTAGSSAGVSDYIVYNNIFTEVRDTNEIPDNILYSTYKNMVVRGDTISLFNRNNEVFRSTSKGSSWKIWLNMSEIFENCYKTNNSNIKSYQLVEDIIVCDKEYLVGGTVSENHYILSVDFGKTWIHYGTNSPKIVDNECYLESGTFTVYNQEDDIISDIVLGTHYYGTYRDYLGDNFYQHQKGDDCYKRAFPSTVWDVEDLLNKQRFITKYQRAYYLNFDSTLNYTSGMNPILLSNNVLNFYVLYETPAIDILSASFAEDNSAHILFVKDSQIVDEYIVPENEPLLAGVDKSNTDVVYCIEKDNSDTLFLAMHNLTTDVRDTISLRIEANPDLFKSFLIGDNLYLIGESNIYISEDKGLTFTTIENPHEYKEADMLYDNAEFFMGKLYLAGSDGILKLNKDYTWENILINHSNAYGFAVESMHSQIHAYDEYAFFVVDKLEDELILSSNRNVLLENPAGIYSSGAYGMDYLAELLKMDYSDKFYYIHYHPTSEYTTPKNETDPDFTTDQGNSIVDYLEILSTTDGRINRSEKVFLDNIQEIKNKLTGIFEKSTPVNIAVNADINPATRELTATVSYYYTEDGVGNQKLSVYLLQDNIKGPQDRKFYAEMMHSADGEYFHRNVFRMYLNEAVSGDEIVNTSADVFGLKKYKIVLPESIKNVEVDLANLKVVAFITKELNSIQDVLQVEEAKVALPEENTVDLSLSNPVELNSEYLFDNLMPRVSITNNGTTVVNQFDLELKLGDETFTHTFHKTVVSGKTVEINVDTIPADFVGNYSYTINGFSNINNSDESGEFIADINTRDNDCKIEGIRLKRDAFDYTKFTFEEDSEKDFGFDTREGDFLFIQDPEDGSLYGAENSGTSLGFVLGKEYGVQGQTVYILLGEADLTEVSEAYLSYYYAYHDGDKAGTAPTYTTEYSSDAGKTWKEFSSINPQITSNTVYNELYPHTSEYLKEYVSLEECVGKKVIVRIGVTAGSDGIGCWLDQVAINDIIPRIQSSTAKLDFGEVTLSDGIKVNKSIQLSNIGIEDLQLDSAKIKGVDASAFMLTPAFTDTTLKANEGLLVGVEFTPTKDQKYLAILEIYCNDPSNEILYIRLEGEGVGTSVNEHEADDNRFTISPNPSSDYITIDFEGQIESIEIVDLFGKRVTMDAEIKTLDVSNLSTGSYTLKIRSKGNVYFKKFVVVK